MESVVMGKLDGLVKIFCRKIILVKDNSALVITAFLFPVSIADADGLVHETDRVHSLADSLDCCGSDTEGFEIFGFCSYTLTYNEEGLLDVPYSLPTGNVCSTMISFSLLCHTQPSG